MDGLGGSIFRLGLFTAIAHFARVLYLPAKLWNLRVTTTLCAQSLRHLCLLCRAIHNLGKKHLQCGRERCCVAHPLPKPVLQIRHFCSASMHLLLTWYKLARRTAVGFPGLLRIKTCLGFHSRTFTVLKGHIECMNFCAIGLCLWRSQAVCCGHFLATRVWTCLVCSFLLCPSRMLEMSFGEQRRYFIECISQILIACKKNKGFSMETLVWMIHCYSSYHSAGASECKTSM